MANRLLLAVLFGIAVLVIRVDGVAAGAGGGPRIVNIYNFVRNSDDRVPNSEQVLFEATRQEMQLTKAAGLPATWALQYDALINLRYQKLFKQQLADGDEIAGWWEIPRPLAEKAGLKWRGRHDWDSASNVGFSPGYTPDERRRLVDVYMADFKQVFGYYPRTVGSWYIDEVTLAYMADKYHVIASCNCKDQVGTDGYTLHGGYWNQAYYPSKLNAYMPAQTRSGQIDIPIFRMLGSDPIYQYGATRDMNTLEPVYPRAGGSGAWVDTFMDNFVHGPSLAFAYTQVGQENSFGWEAIKPGLSMQIALLVKLSKSGDVRVQTLAESGEWFTRHYPLTPATSVVALSDWTHQDRKSVWYDSRFYRINLYWDNAGLHIRDLHLFDETVASPTHETPLTRTTLSYATLPVMDGALWSKKQIAGMWPMQIAANGEATPLAGLPMVTEPSQTELCVTQPLAGSMASTAPIAGAARDGGSISMLCGEDSVVFTATDSNHQPLKWALDLIGGDRQKSVVKSVGPSVISYTYNDAKYQLKLANDAGSCAQRDGGAIRITASSSGKISFDLSGDRTGR
jgi:hypothetical protein